jgi:succinate dehydrogenase / fumarate reductase iron-sulfur subunit
MKVRLKIWRQKNSKSKGKFVTYDFDDVSTEMSFLEMLDALNTKLITEGKEPVAFDHDCREGICGSCGLYINGYPHSPVAVIKDLMVDRSAFDKIQIAGGFISVNTGAASEANSILCNKKNADIAFESASCIGCGACVAACKNASAMLFLSAKISQLALLPQGKVEARDRVRAMVSIMDELGFGNCSNTGACEAQCPKSIKLTNIARMNREYYKAI